MGWQGILYGRIYVDFSFLTVHKVCTKAILLGERSVRIREVKGSNPSRSTKQFVLEPDSLRKRVRVRFLFIGGSAEGLLGTVNEQRQGIIVVMVSCLLFCGIKVALCELDRPPIWRVWG